MWASPGGRESNVECHNAGGLWSISERARHLTSLLDLLPLRGPFHEGGEDQPVQPVRRRGYRLARHSPVRCPPSL